MNELGDRLPPGQQLVAADKWPLVGERVPSPISADTPWALSLLEGDRSVRLTLDEITALRGANFAGASMFGATFVDRDSGDAAMLNRTTIIDQDAVESLCPLQQDFVREHAA
ncbi:MAG: hypothetical protein VB878_06375 [Pirellulaceae bacterium]